MAKRSKTKAKAKTKTKVDGASELPGPVSPAEAPELGARLRSKTKTMGDGSSGLPGSVSPAELPTLRARLIAALTGGFVPVWRWLQQSSIGWFISYVFSRPRVRLDSSAGSHYNPVQIVDPSPASEPVKLRAVWFQPLKKPKQLKKPEQKLKLFVVDGIEVPLDQEKRFQEYCERALNVQGRSSLCHYCVSVWNCVPNGIVPNSGMRKHCIVFHDGACTPCLDVECNVLFNEGDYRERRLHQYFFHERPIGWWLNR